MFTGFPDFRKVGYISLFHFDPQDEMDDGLLALDRAKDPERELAQFESVALLLGGGFFLLGITVTATTMPATTMPATTMPTTTMPTAVAATPTMTTREGQRR